MCVFFSSHCTRYCLHSQVHDMFIPTHCVLILMCEFKCLVKSMAFHLLWVQNDILNLLGAKTICSHASSSSFAFKRRPICSPKNRNEFLNSIFFSLASSDYGFFSSITAVTVVLLLPLLLKRQLMHITCILYIFIYSLILRIIEFHIQPRIFNYYIKE